MAAGSDSLLRYIRRLVIAPKPEATNDAALLGTLSPSATGWCAKRGHRTFALHWSANVRCPLCAPWKGVVLQWVQIPPGNCCSSR